MSAVSGKLIGPSGSGGWAKALFSTHSQAFSCEFTSIRWSRAAPACWGACTRLQRSLLPALQGQDPGRAYPQASPSRGAKAATRGRPRRAAAHRTQGPRRRAASGKMIATGQTRSPRGAVGAAAEQDITVSRRVEARRGPLFSLQWPHRNISFLHHYLLVRNSPLKAAAWSASQYLESGADRETSAPSPGTVITCAIIFDDVYVFLRHRADSTFVYGCKRRKST
jgi:hypothetical protein